MLSITIEKEESSKLFERLSMHSGVVYHIRASALTTADRRPPSWNRITDSTHAPPVNIIVFVECPSCPD
jgi:hypothetical protein